MSINLKGKDIVAIVMIASGTYLMATGIDGIVGFCMLSICGSYFGYDIIQRRSSKCERRTLDEIIIGRK